MSWSQFANLISNEDRNLESWKAAIEGNPNLPDAALKVAIMHFISCKDVSAVEFLGSFVVELVNQAVEQSVQRTGLCPFCQEPIATEHEHEYCYPVESPSR